MGFIKLGNKMKYYCSKCNVDIEKKVYEYSKENLGKILCRNCQKQKIVEPTNEISKKKKYDKDFNMIKGRVAEALVEQLFLKMGFNVYRYGMENTIPSIMKLIKGVNKEVENVIRKMPDFVVQKNNHTFFIEVKFRKEENFSIKDLKEDYYNQEYPFPNAYFVIVSKKHIKCLSYKDLKAGKNISKKYNGFYLGNVSEFDTNKEVIKDFCDYAVKFFEGV